jgi:diguanylate cyclase (GGDEF)-like protein/PAS domain S-box-containing protein
MGRKPVDTHLKSNSRAELLAEIDALKRQISEKKDIEERCLRAETALEEMEERSRLMRESAPLGIFVVDGQGGIMIINQKMREMLSLSPTPDDELLNIFENPELLEQGVADMVRRCLEHKERVVFEHPSTCPHSECEYLRYHLSPVSDADGATIAAIAFVEDVTELNRAERSLRESEERYRLMFQSAPVAMMERDASALRAHIERLGESGISDIRDFAAQNPREVSGWISMIKTVDYNGAFLELMELSHNQASIDGIQMAHFEDAPELAREIVLMVAEGTVTNEKERTFVTLKGNRKNVLAKTLVVSGHENTFSRIIIALIDISRRKQAEEALRISEQRFREQAMRDDLTGLYNRRYLYGSLADLLESCTSAKSRLSVIFMDIDHFKDVVDAYGHLNGSQAIREFAFTIRDCLESPAYAVAYAGDEFVVVLPGFDSARAAQKAMEIRDRVEHTVYLRDQEPGVRLRASFGIATFPEDAADMRGLLAAADQALFAVKLNGKNAVGLYGQSRRRA